MNLLAVFAGGLIGAGLRLGIDALLPHTAPGSFPWSTLLINVAGSFALGLLVARVWPTAPGWLRYGLGTGLLGAFTTFSAVVISLIQLFGEYPAIAALYLLASLVLGLGAAGLGLRLGHRPSARITADE
ncbi:MAG: CrcB family protein [Microbacteriaceae bacterium]|jgi:CrcB protein